MKAMILAAGRGERMRPLTDHCPKPLLPLANKPLLAYHLEKLAQAGFDEVVINHAYLGQQIEDYCGDGSQWGLQLHYSPEPVALETGGALWQALPQLGDAPFLLVNGDVWCELPFAQIKQAAAGDESSGLVGRLWLVDNPQHNPSGDFHLSTSGLLQSAAEPRLTFSGCSWLRAELLHRYRQSTVGDVPAFPLKPLLLAAIADGVLAGSHYTGRWVDVGTPERLQRLENELLATVEPG